jgi:pimeloyl-ACP methyl ester carboxylesterase
MDATAKSLTRNEGGAHGWSAPAEALLTTADGVRIRAAYVPPDARDAELAVVIGHGFSGALERHDIQRAAMLLARRMGVVSLSFRGHGQSEGLSTVGDREVLDLQAAVDWARSLGFRRVATLGFSMGGAVVLRHAALYGGVESVVAVSSPARWYYRGTAPMRRLHWVVMKPLGRAVGRLGLKTRIDPREWSEVPVPPVDAVARLAAREIPLLVVHGDSDPYFPLDHPRSLHEAAGSGRSELWIEPGFGHAENSATDALIERVGEWLTGAR